MKIVVDGIPKAQPRVKAHHVKTKDGREFTAVRTPPSANTWKALVARAAQEHPEFPETPWQRPVEVDLWVYLLRPQRLCRKKSPTYAMYAPTKKRNDVDNLLKAVLDALTDAGLWIDDGQVVAAKVYKMYHAVGDRPRAVMILRELEGDGLKED